MVLLALVVHQMGHASGAYARIHSSQTECLFLDAGSGGAKLAHAVDIVAAFHVFMKAFQDSVTEVAPLREGSEQQYDCILVGLVCWPLSAHVAADVRAERSSIEASLRQLNPTPPSNARWLPRR